MDSTAVDLLDKAIRERTRTLRAQVKRCRKLFSEEAVHDLRVAMRRLLALMDFLAFFGQSPALRKARRDIKGHLDAFDTLRDTQVMLLETSQRITELPAVEPFHRSLQKQEKRLLRRAQKDINALKNGYAKPLRNALKTASQHGEDVLAPVDDAYQTVLHRLALVDESNTATIHRVRIAFKRFRYSVEVVRPLLKTMPEDLIQRLHDYQTLMGEIQDMEVMLRSIDEFATRNQQCMMEPVRQFYEHKHQERVSAYIQRMNEVYSFWRTAPERALPWEVSPVGETVVAQDEALEEAVLEQPSEAELSSEPVQAGMPEAQPAEHDEEVASEPAVPHTEGETAIPASTPTEQEEVSA